MGWLWPVLQISFITMEITPFFISNLAHCVKLTGRNSFLKALDFETLCVYKLLSRWHEFKYKNVVVCVLFTIYYLYIMFKSYIEDTETSNIWQCIIKTAKMLPWHNLLSTGVNYSFCMYFKFSGENVYLRLTYWNIDRSKNSNHTMNISSQILEGGKITFWNMVNRVQERKKMVKNLWLNTNHSSLEWAWVLKK